ncbi:MAG TPA: hypothetical protein VE360_16915 [Pyrinomonadaceae bacterium]|nr:hypothetical protein [Pyrinomonadaceae bacterium]
MKTLSSCVLLCLALAGEQAAARQAPAQADAAMTAEKWREDLRFMAAEMRARHKNLFHATTRDEFEAAVNKLHERIPTLARHEIVVELMRLVASVGDGHTHMGMGQDPKLGFRRYPVRLYFFRDGLFVRGAAPEHARLAGARVLKIGNATADEAYRAVLAVTPRDNEMGARTVTPFLLVTPEILHALRLVEDMERARFVFEVEGKPVEVELRPGAQESQAAWGVPPGWTDARAADSPAPLWMKAPDNLFWFEHLKDERALYVQYNGVANKPDETVADFFRRVYAFAEANAVERLVIDVRNNGGGNNFLNRPIVVETIKSAKLNRRGHLFVITGRQTFSAAQNFVNEMEKYTNAIFVGEPTGARPNHYGDAARIVLPHSGLTVRASTLWWQDVDPRDSRPWTPPQISAALTSADYRANRDPALRAALTHSETKSLSETLLDALANGGTEDALKLYRAYRADPAHEYLSTEGEINTLGYRLLELKRVEQAIEIFKLNVADYPRSANVYDSLADAYEAAGQKELAIKSSEQVLATLPQDTSDEGRKNGIRAGTLERLRRLKGTKQ